MSSRALLTRLLPAFALATVAFGTFRYMGEQRGLFSPVVGVLMMVALVGIALAVLIWGGSILIRRIEAAEAEQARALAEFREFFEESPDMFFVATPDGYFIDCNPAASATLGYTRSELTSRPFVSFVHPDDVAASPAETAALGSGMDTVSFENRYRRADGSYATIEWQSRYLEDRQQIYAVARDVTATREQEQDLRTRQRRDSLGVLAGGVAHDFNNLLVGVLGNAELLETRIADPDSLELARQITLAGRRAADLTQQMLAYSGRGKFVVEDVSVCGVVEEMTALLASVLSKKATFVTECADAIPPIRADATQVRQVVMNLLSNASEALDGQPGEITLRVDQFEATQEDLRAYSCGQELPEGVYVRLSVADSGRGMDEATLARIFDPYFTTKFTGRGLGLAGVFGIVEGHGGGVRVASEPQAGSTFTVIFPAVTPAAVLAPVSLSTPGAAATSALVVLVADDEAIVRAVTSRMLEASGHTVVEADDGIEAVERFDEDRERFDLAVIDLVMPGLDGEQVTAHIREHRHDLPILISSGYNADEVRTRFAATTSTRFLQKPFTRDELNTCVAGAVAPQQAM